MIYGTCPLIFRTIGICSDVDIQVRNKAATATNGKRKIVSQDKHGCYQGARENIILLSVQTHSNSYTSCLAPLLLAMRWLAYNRYLST